MMDEFLEPGKSGQRLIDEYRKYGSLTIGFDFDGTVFDYHGTGATYEQVRELLRDLKRINCKLVCWTAQKDLPFVETFLRDNNIPFDGINANGIDLGWDSRKPFFSALLDDRAGLLQVFEELTAVVLQKDYDDYTKLLKSGMFFEFHPELTGDWGNDQDKWLQYIKQK
jgi:hydroxymethylpyrimidine pyrophosphatase-like HAD family hydrolase